jgi:hypothetical protein
VKSSISILNKKAPTHSQQSGCKLTALSSTKPEKIMRDQEFAKTSNSVLLSIMGRLRWASPSSNGDSWDVDAAHIDGTDYMSYTTGGGIVVWDVKKRGGYPDAEEWAELEAAL